MGVFFAVFDNSNVLIVAIFIILFKLASNNSNGYQIDANHDHEDQAGESVASDSGLEIIEQTPGNSEKLIIPNVIACKGTNGVAYFAHANDLNDSYLTDSNDPLTTCHASKYVELFLAVERDIIVDWNAMIAMWKHLLTAAIKKEGIFTNPLFLSKPAGNNLRMTEYIQYTSNVPKFYLCNSALANFVNDYNDTGKDDYASTMHEAAFVEYNITSRVCEARMEFSKDTDIIFRSLFGNTTKYANDSETKSEYAGSVDTLRMILLFATMNFFVCT